MGRLLIKVSTLTTSISLSSESDDSCTSGIIGDNVCWFLGDKDDGDDGGDDDKHVEEPNDAE